MDDTYILFYFLFFFYTIIIFYHIDLYGTRSTMCENINKIKRLQKYAVTVLKKKEYTDIDYSN